MWTPVSVQLSFGSPSPAQESPLAAPWSAQAETELRRQAEKSRNHWKARCLKAEGALRDLAAAAGDGAAVKFMARDSSQYKDEVRVLRLRLAR